MIQECSVERNSQNKQLNVVYPKGFPLCAYYNDMDRLVARQVPWHWHEEIEMIVAIQGRALVHVYQQEIVLEKGDALWINAGALHQVEKMTEEETILYSVVFSHRLLDGEDDSVFAKKYMLPLIQAKKLSFVKFDHQNAEEAAIAKKIQEAYLACQKEMYGYEFIVRERMCEVCLFVLSWHHERDVAIREEKEVDRLKQMMAYLQRYYMDPIRLIQLAKHANISEREVLRCFQQHLKESPMQVLMKYRLMKACELLGTSEKSIGEIASACGFGDASYFAKQFKRLLHRSPSAYRAMMK